MEPNLAILGSFPQNVIHMNLQELNLDTMDLYQYLVTRDPDVFIK